MLFFFERLVLLFPTHQCSRDSVIQQPDNRACLLLLLLLLLAERYRQLSLIFPATRGEQNLMCLACVRVDRK